MNAIAITGIVCITLILLIVTPLAIAWSAEKSIKELIFGQIIQKVWDPKTSSHKYVVISKDDSKWDK